MHHRLSIFHSAFGPCLERNYVCFGRSARWPSQQSKKSQNATAPPRRAHVMRAGNDASRLSARRDARVGCRRRSANPNRRLRKNLQVEYVGECYRSDPMGRTSISSPIAPQRLPFDEFAHEGPCIRKERPFQSNRADSRADLIPTEHRPALRNAAIASTTRLYQRGFSPE